MTDHPITPPPELVEQWVRMLEFLPDKQVFSKVAQWGADQELEACCALLNKFNDGFWCEELRLIKKAGKAKLQEKAQAIVDAVDEALWKDNPRFNAEYRAASAALMEAINQTQNGQGMISAAELHLIAMEMKKL